MRQGGEIPPRRSEAIQRVVAMLRQGEQIDPSAIVQAALAPASVEEAPAEGSNENPYSDSFLFTSCNDCFKINPRVFQYDSNQQAYIADAAAGNFAELVKAAAGCPARCIHPGTPRPGDSTATAQILAMAAKLQ